MKVDLVIFDLDGTLIDSSTEIHYCVNQSLAEYKLSPISLESVKSKIGYSALELFEHIDSELLKNKLVLGFRTHLLDIAGNMSPVLAGVLDFLKFLRSRNIKTAVATSKPDKIAIKILNNKNLNIDFIKGSDNLPLKPDPKILIECMRGLNVCAHKSVMIGDTSLDIQAGEAAGCHTLAVTTGYETLESLKLANPDQIFSSMEEVQVWLKDKLES